MGFSVVAKEAAQSANLYSEPMKAGKERALASLKSAMNPEASQPVETKEEFSLPIPTPNPISSKEQTLTEGQGDTIEGAASESSPAPSPEVTKAPEEPISSQYAVLARKEKALRAKAQAQAAEIKTREDAIRAREEAIKAKESEYQTKYISKDRLTQDTINALAEAGLTYEQITNMMLNQPSPEDRAYKSEISRLEAKLKAIEEAQEGTRKSIADQQTESYQQAVNQIRHEAKQLVNSDPAFEMIKETNSLSDVVELIESTFREGLGDEYPKGTVLSVEEAAKMVEDELVEQALKIARAKKIQERLKPATPAQSVKSATEAPKQIQMKTLTNAVGSSRPLTSRERAILAAKGEKF